MGKALYVLEGHTKPVRACAVLGDGRRVVSASDDRTLRVWSSDMGRALHILEGHADSVYACAVLGDGRRVASASADSTIRVWDCDTGLCLGVAHGIDVTALVTYDNQIIAGDKGGNVWFFEVRDLAPSLQPSGSWFREAFTRNPGSADHLSATAFQRARTFLLDAFQHDELRQLVIELHKPLHDRLPVGRRTSATDFVDELINEIAIHRELVHDFVALVRRERPRRDDLDTFATNLCTAIRVMRASS